MILETEPGWYIQVGFGETAGVPADSYALEIREGSNDLHFRAISGALDKVIEAFSGFFLGAILRGEQSSTLLVSSTDRYRQAIDP